MGRRHFVIVTEYRLHFLFLPLPFHLPLDCRKSVYCGGCIFFSGYTPFLTLSLFSLLRPASILNFSVFFRIPKAQRLYFSVIFWEYDCCRRSESSIKSSLLSRGFDIFSRVTSIGVLLFFSCKVLDYDI